MTACINEYDFPQSSLARSIHSQRLTGSSSGTCTPVKTDHTQVVRPPLAWAVWLAIELLRPSSVVEPPLHPGSAPEAKLDGHALQPDQKSSCLSSCPILRWPASLGPGRSYHCPPMASLQQYNPCCAPAWMPGSRMIRAVRLGNRDGMVWYIHTQSFLLFLFNHPPWGRGATLQHFERRDVASKVQILCRSVALL
jgi:hypothetical protein